MARGWLMTQELKILKLKTWSHTTAHQSPCASAASRLPPASGHHKNRLGRFVWIFFGEWRRAEGAETPSLRDPASWRQDPEIQRVASGVVPGFVRTDHTMPAADLPGAQKKPDQREGGSLLSIVATDLDGAAMQFAIPTSLRVGLQMELLHQGLNAVGSGIKHEVRSGNRCDQDQVDRRHLACPCGCGSG